jgi:hypothetical protein
MLKSLIAACALAAVAAMGFAGLAQADRWDCQMRMTKGACPIVISQPSLPVAKPSGK